MKFNRRLFKEAYKAGYKKGKRLNESIEVEDFFENLWDNFGMRTYKAELFDKNYKFKGGTYYVRFRPLNELFITLVPEYDNAGPRKDIHQSDVVSIDDSYDFYILTLKNGLLLHIYVYERIKINHQ